MIVEDNIPRWVRVVVFKMTQEEFSKKLGITQGRVAQVEARGYFSEANKTRIMDIAKAKGVTFRREWFIEIPMGGQK